ncbi:hypothetical protein B7494_g3996 [Chlorociboria aeruginascens]|nr:hypothetical protein B7494_g3996 [Chlorociboria aeruginascens]
MLRKVWGNEEERIPGYNPKNFFPVNPGDLLNNRYRIVAKIGWGTTSTVWLAQDIHRRRWKLDRYVTLKINVSGFTDEDAAQHERNITKSLEKNPTHNGFDFVRILVDSFEAIGPEGKHLCLVYKPMREPLWLFQSRLPNNKIPPPLLKAYLIIDLKMDNILVGFEHPSILKDYVIQQAKKPMSRKTKDGKSVYLSHNNFGPMKSYRVLPKIADFGLAQFGNSPEPLRYPIQPPLFHAPEVLLGTSWTYSVDIWNLGVLI